MIISDGTGVFTLVSSDETQELTLRLTDALCPEFRTDLEAQGFRVPDGDARSVLTETVVAVANNPAVWTGVAGVIVAFLRRHRGKVHRFEIEGRPVSIENYSARQARKLAADLLALSRERGPR